MGSYAMPWEEDILAAVGRATGSRITDGSKVHTAASRSILRDVYHNTMSASMEEREREYLRI